MKIWKPIFGFLYTLLYAVAAFLDLGFGHGTGIFLAPFFPLFFPLPWILLMTALYLSTNATTPRKRLYFILLMTFHYAITAFGVFFMWEGNVKGTMKMWDEQFAMIVITLGIYSSGQAVIWLAFIYGGQDQQIEKLA